jgi:mono/diheme cytochrome c family protein
MLPSSANGLIGLEMNHLSRAVSIIGPFLLCCEPAFAQDVAAGEQLARAICIGCHEIEARPTPSIGAGPPFRGIARVRGMTQKSIEVYLSTAHEVMPNYVLTQKQIRDVAGYIIELRSKPESSQTKRKRRAPR